jgi:hypothetical protein
MDAEIANVTAAILHVSRKSGALYTRDAATTANAIRVSCVEWERTERALVTPDLKEAAGWTGYEMKIFQLGRALDLVMKKLGVWRGQGEVLDACAEILAEARYGRGRQSFAATLGDHGDGGYSAPLVAALSDEAMAGYAIKALHQGNYGAFLGEVRAAGELGRPWVRNAARAYATKFGGRRPRETRAAREA